MNCLITVLAACLALANAGYVEHYQGATSFSSFDLKSSPIEGNRLVHTKATTSYDAPHSVKGSTDHAVVSYEAKPVISTVYAAPITKTLTYSSAPNLHYVAPVPVQECAHKIVTPVQTSVTYGVPATASHSGSSGSGSGYQSFQATQAHKAPLASYGTSSTVGHTISHHYSAPVSSSIIYTPPKVTQTISSQGAYGGINHQSASYGSYKGPSQPAPIVETLVDVAPPKLIQAQPSPAYGVPATNSNFHQVSQIVPATSLQSISPVKTTSNYVATGSHATSHQYKAATIPVKSTPAYYIAPGRATSGSSGSWSESSKSHGHSFTTSHSYNSHGQTNNAQQYLPPKTTLITPIAVTSLHSSSQEIPSSPSRVYLPPREYLPPAQDIKGAGHVNTGSFASISYAETPHKLTVSKVLPQQQTYHSSSSASTANAASHGTQYGTAAILSPLHVHTIQKTPVLAYAPKHHCTEDH